MTIATPGTTSSRAQQIKTVEFYFDPGCPWAWLSSRWMLSVADQLGIEVQWRTLSLKVLNGDADAPDKQVKRRMTEKALRIMEALRAQGRIPDIGRFYTEIGNRLHNGGEDPSDALLEAAVDAAGVSDMASAAEDPAWDGPKADSTHEATGLVGKDVGAPVIAWDGGEHAIFGPVVSPAPKGEDALRVWEAVVTLAETGKFYELKRTRTAPPDFS